MLPKLDNCGNCGHVSNWKKQYSPQCPKCSQWSDIEERRKYYDVTTAGNDFHIKAEAWNKRQREILEEKEVMNKFFLFIGAILGWFYFLFKKPPVHKPWVMPHRKSAPPTGGIDLDFGPEEETEDEE